MKKLCVLLLALMLLAVSAFALAENAEFIPQLRLEDMELLGQRWVSRDESGVEIGYAVTNEDQSIWTYYDLNGDLTSYDVSNADFTLTVTYDPFGNVINVYVTADDGLTYYYEAATDSWAQWSDEAGDFIPVDIVMEVNFEGVEPLVIYEQAAE